MALLDGISKKLTSAGQNVVKGTKDFADITRLNGQVSDEQKQITVLYTKIGEMFYEKFGKDINVLGTEGICFQDSCDAITASFDRIEQYQDEVQQIKGVVNCKQCGAELPNSAVFCSACGAAIEKPVPEPVSEPEAAAKRFCVGCGTELSPGAVFCTSCGQKAE